MSWVLLGSTCVRKSKIDHSIFTGVFGSARCFSDGMLTSIIILVGDKIPIIDRTTTNRQPTVADSF